MKPLKIYRCSYCLQMCALLPWQTLVALPWGRSSAPFPLPLPDLAHASKGHAGGLEAYMGPRAVGCACLACMQAQSEILAEVCVQSVARCCGN